MPLRARSARFALPMSCLVMITALAMLVPAGPATAYDDVVALWNNVRPPKAPGLEERTQIDAHTALLILDIEERTCNAERRPRCLDTVPHIAALAERMRNAGLPVLYSLTSKGTTDTILPSVKPLRGDPIVQASVNKFYETALQDELQQRGITTVIITGTAAHGAVLHTATAAAQRGYRVILPVDCLSASTLYVEQASVWAIHSGPGTRKRTTLTRSAAIRMP